MQVLFGFKHFPKDANAEGRLWDEFPNWKFFFVNVCGRFRNESCNVILFVFVFSPTSLMVLASCGWSWCAVKAFDAFPPLPPVKRCI